uniref:Uncharacterized protein n=1 Tax=Anguilla anguilla TaxID=7936 RepID=A0A0E9PK68_ANGAN
MTGLITNTTFYCQASFVGPSL